MEELSQERMLKKLIAELETMHEFLEELSEKLDRLDEKVSNLSLPGSDYSVEDYDSY